jgi:FAD/FMN-containing dehydrogenase
MSTVSRATSAVSEAFRHIAGRVTTPTDSTYDAERRVYYGSIDAFPAAIIRPADAADVQRVVTAARAAGLELAVRSGGHSIAGHSTTDGGVVVDLRSLATIEIDAASQTLWAGAGAEALKITNAAEEHGLVIGFGDSGSVGVGGITLGGGVGYLTRKFGLTIDSLLAAEIVTANGQLLHVDSQHHPDLFWAIRGGGGNFGIVTRFKFQLHALPQFTGGILVLPATPETIEGFTAAALAAPDELSSIANIMPAPPMPFLPAEVHGQLVFLGMLACAGAPDDAERALAPFRALAKPLADLVKPMAYSAMYPPEDPNARPTAVARTMYLDGIDSARARTIHDILSESDANIRVAQIRVLGGAAARVGADATAYPHRAKAMIVNVAAFYDGDEDRARRSAWVREFESALEPDDGAVYVNFLADEGADRVRAAYGSATWERLRRIKAVYDPSNVFHRNQNIPPAES